MKWLAFFHLTYALRVLPKQRRQLYTSSSSSSPPPPPCKWFTINQPLNHFGYSQLDFQQRVCVIDDFVDSSKPPSIFLYTGNESPVEEYVNNTGLMYELAPKHNSLLIFVEHRYQSKSTPKTQGVDNCLSFDTVEQALADFAAVVSYVSNNKAVPTSQDSISDYDFSTFTNAPVVAFGGSYGGMLAAWMRFKYPSSIVGAIAASAPIWGLPLTNPKIDGAAAVLSNSMENNMVSARALCQKCNPLLNHPLLISCFVGNADAGGQFEG